MVYFIPIWYLAVVRFSLLIRALLILFVLQHLCIKLCPLVIKTVSYKILETEPKFCKFVIMKRY